ncbi:MAG TPA: phosphatase PAP2 family protein [Thermoanaerobaculia bacterium]|nr:phosphatase PAP2 family protein [Thermoanaerobaculia bacterium]
MIPLRNESVWRRVLSIDERLLLVVRRWESRLMTRLMRGLTHLGDPASWVLLGLALGFSGGIGPRLCALLGTAAFLALGISQPLKRLCRRERPSRGIGGFAALAENPDVFSFPSGHTSVAFAIAAAFAGQAAGPLGTLLLVLAAGIGVSRVYLGAHYPLDVAAGALVGTVCGIAAKLLVVEYPLLKLLGYATLVSFR